MTPWWATAVIALFTLIVGTGWRIRHDRSAEIRTRQIDAVVEFSRAVLDAFRSIGRASSRISTASEEELYDVPGQHVWPPDVQELLDGAFEAINEVMKISPRITLFYAPESATDIEASACLEHLHGAHRAESDWPNSVRDKPGGSSYVRHFQEAIDAHARFLEAARGELDGIGVWRRRWHSARRRIQERLGH